MKTETPENLQTAAEIAAAAIKVIIDPQQRAPFYTHFVKFC